jgi:AAHS family 4-hydroxybenzoate transporter-like MFS transporter
LTARRPGDKNDPQDRKTGDTSIAKSPSQAAGTVDVAAVIDAQPVGGYQVRLLLMCAAVLFIDGFDTQAIGYVAPALVKDLGITRAALAPVLSAALFGLMIGALFLGPLADRLGRKKIIITSVLVFGLCSLATAFVQDTTSLLFIRFLTGLGLGGAMPNTVALTAEFSPHRRRATMVMTMFCGFSAGAALGGLIAAAVIPAFGWRGVFLIGGLAPLVLVPILVKALPESIRFLALSGRPDAVVGARLKAVFPALPLPLPEDARFTVHEPRLSGLPVAHLFRENRAVATLLLWTVFFCSLLVLYFLSSWLPTVMSDLGVSVSLGATISSLLQFGGCAGALVLGRFIDRFSFRALTLMYLLAAAAVALIGQATHSLPVVAAAIFCAGFCIVGGQSASNALASGLYPTAVRSTGVGWALGIGRLGSILGPLFGVVLLNLPSQSLFATIAGPALVAALAAFGLSLIARPKAVAAQALAE